MKTKRVEASALILAVCLLPTAALPSSSGGVSAQQAGSREAHHAPVTTKAGSASDRLKLSDVTLINQNGQPVRVYSDLVKGKIVAINTIFTTCTTVCPLMGANFARLQRLLPAAVRAQVQLISISVDPIADTPLRLRTWAEGFGAQPGWTLLTGSVRDVEAVLKGLGIFVPDKSDHAPVVVIGSDARGEWTRANGLASATDLAGLITRLVESGGH